VVAAGVGAGMNWRPAVPRLGRPPLRALAVRGQRPEEEEETQLTKQQAQPQSRGQDEEPDEEELLAAENCPGL